MVLYFKKENLLLWGIGGVGAVHYKNQTHHSLPNWSSYRADWEGSRRGGWSFLFGQRWAFSRSDQRNGEQQMKECSCRWTALCAWNLSGVQWPQLTFLTFVSMGRCCSCNYLLSRSASPSQFGAISGVGNCGRGHFKGRVLPHRPPSLLIIPIHLTFSPHELRPWNHLEDGC